jgi:hypothetical protein
MIFWRHLPLPDEKQRITWNALCFLGLYRAAYRTFKHAAKVDKTFEHLEITLLVDQSPMSGTSLPMPVSHFVMSVSSSEEGMHGYCHAEIQVLGLLDTALPPDEHPYPFIGRSKKACWPYYHALSNYETKIGLKYGVRGCHGQAPASWHTGVLHENVRSRAKLLACLRALTPLVE